MNVSIGDVYLEVVDNVVVLTLPSKYTLKIQHPKYADLFMRYDLNRYGKYSSDVHDESYAYFSSLGSQIASVESMTSQFY